MKKKINHIVSIVMGSKSDYSTMKFCEKVLKILKISYETNIVSAHRTPDRMFKYAKMAEKNKVSVIIAGAGGSAHLPGMIAALTPIPVIGVPTSIGYGYGEKGVAALASMLQSCSLGLTVVNIDNGVGAGAAAANIASRIKSNSRY